MHHLDLALMSELEPLVTVMQHWHHDISDHWQHSCLLHSLSMLTTKKTSEPLITGHLWRKNMVCVWYSTTEVMLVPDNILYYGGGMKLCVHWQQGKCQLWIDWFMSWSVVPDPWPLNLWDTHSGGQCANHLAMTHPSKMDWYLLNGITHTGHNDELIRAGEIHHWAAYFWGWHLDIILYEGDMRTYLKNVLSLQGEIFYW